MLMQCEILLLGVQKSHSRDALKSWVFLVRLFTESWRVTFNCIHTESRSSKLSHKMTWKNVLRCAVVQKQDWRIDRFSSECLVQWWSTLLSIRLCLQQELCVLGSSSTRLSPSETTALCEVHSMGCHIKTWHNRTVLVWEWCWRYSYSQ